MSVYFISNGAYVKIGVARNPKKRLKALQTGNPHKLELMRVIKGGYAEEAALHGHFAHLRVEGEWFEYHQEMHDIDPKDAKPNETKRRVTSIGKRPGWNSDSERTQYNWRIKIQRRKRKSGGYTMHWLYVLYPGGGKRVTKYGGMLPFKRR